MSLEDFDIRAPIAKVDADQGIVYAWAYRTRDEEGREPKDQSGKVVRSTEELEKAARGFMRDSRRGDIMHVKDAPAHLIASIVVTDDIAKALGITSKERGWFTGWQFDTSTPEWKAVKDRRLGELSIKGRGHTRAFEAAA